jgi:protein-ribulosamine 3-kinase
LNEHTWTEIERAVAASSPGFRIEQRTSVGGGCINPAWCIVGRGGRYFVKTNDAARAAMFEAEAAGLTELGRARAVRVPQPICYGADAEATWLVLEHIDLHSRNGESDAVLGAQLAQLHRCTGNRYGWFRDNTIGSTPQHNEQADDWPAFWREKRLGVQLALARGNGHTAKLQAEGERLLDALPQFFTTYRPAPSLLHGDLWAGNAAADEHGRPVIFDPAVYYGDREADIAMTELFDGYSLSFYAAYRDAYPLDAGYAVRKDLYNLYHVLNHLNLFGRGYLRQAEAMIGRLLSQTHG